MGCGATCRDIDTGANLADDPDSGMFELKVDNGKGETQLKYANEQQLAMTKWQDLVGVFLDGFQDEDDIEEFQILVAFPPRSEKYPVKLRQLNMYFHRKSTVSDLRRKLECIQKIEGQSKCELIMYIVYPIQAIQTTHSMLKTCYKQKQDCQEYKDLRPLRIKQDNTLFNYHAYVIVGDLIGKAQQFDCLDDDAVMAISKEVDDIALDEMEDVPVSKKPRRRFSSLKQGGLDKSVTATLSMSEIKVAWESASTTLQPTPIPTPALTHAPRYAIPTPSIGIQNLGNSCYLSVSLQALLHIQPILALLNTENSRGTILHEISQIYALLSNKDVKTPINPISFKRFLGSKNVRYNNEEQNDAHGLLSYLISRIHIELKQAWTANGVPSQLSQLKDYGSPEEHADKFWQQHCEKDYSPITGFLYGQYIITETCENCHNQTTEFDVYNMISLDIEEGTRKLSIEQALENARAPISNTNFRCNNCQSRNKGSVTKEIWRTPQILIIHLKRFKEERGVLTKINRPISYPTTLKIEKYVQSPTQAYSLFGSIVHYGDFSTGHYMAICQNSNGKWLEFNDEHITSVESVTSNENAYMLFYELR